MAAPAASSSPLTSGNWAGYQVLSNPATYNSVQGKWTVPRIDPSIAGLDTASANWVGIGGGCTDPPTCATDDPTLIQAGTDEDNTSGAESYYAWWEAIPGPSMPISGGVITTGQNFEVKPGDVITVTIGAAPNVLWSITIENQRAGQTLWTFNQMVPYVAAGQTAEWIEEAPLSAGTGGAGQSSLSNFHRITFSDLEANGAPPELTEDGKIVMVDSTTGHVTARPSVPAADGFAVCYGAGNCQGPSGLHHHHHKKKKS